MYGPSNVYFHGFHENPFTFSLACVQRRMMKSYMDSVKSHGDAFEFLLDVYKIHLQRLALPIPLFHLNLPMTYIFMNILALTHIKSVFPFLDP